MTRAAAGAPTVGTTEAAWLFSNESPQSAGAYTKSSFSARCANAAPPAAWSAQASWDSEQRTPCGRYGWLQLGGGGGGGGDRDASSDEPWRSRRVGELLAVQQELKQQLHEAKRTLMLPDNSWSYDLLVASNTSQRRDLSYVEALEKETAILQRRVDACKSRIMLVTSLL